MFIASSLPQVAAAQSSFRLEAAGGIGIPAFLDWGKGRSAGPAASFGVSSRMSDRLGWVATVQWHYFSANKEAAETSDVFTSEPPGEILQVTRGDLEGGGWQMLSFAGSLRYFLQSFTRSKTYLKFGVVGGTTRQQEATILETRILNGEQISSERVEAATEGSDFAIGVTFGLGASIPLDRKLEAVVEIGYSALMTPDDSFPDNPDFLSAMAGVRFGF